MNERIVSTEAGISFLVHMRSISIFCQKLTCRLIAIQT